MRRVERGVGVLAAHFGLDPVLGARALDVPRLPMLLSVEGPDRW